MEIQKAKWANSGNTMNMSFPIAKVNKEKRTVSGFATLDNIDRHGDIVTAEASVKAFERFSGNLREMHQPIAAGKVVSFRPDSFTDKETGKTYSGVYVDAYVSKGAQDAWEKILDGTYTGFSIGGNIIDQSMEKIDGDESDQLRRVIKDFDLHELSLVDSPANQFANIFSIQKTVDGMTLDGFAKDIVMENVFWCKEDEVASTSTVEKKECSVCDKPMTNIGWVEQSDINKFDAVNSVIDTYFKKDDAPTSNHEATETAAPGPQIIDSTTAINLYPDQNKDKSKIAKGGNEMTEDTNIEAAEATQADEVTPQEVEEAVPAVETTEEEAIEKAADISEVEADDLDIQKMLSDLKASFGDALEKNLATHTATVQDISRIVEDTKTEFAKTIDELKSKYEELNKSITDAFGKIDNVNDKLEGLESATAVKKSSDLEGSTGETKIQKSIWQGHFLGVNSL